MIKLIRKLFGLCEHKWAVKSEYETTCFGTRSGYIYLQQCEKCGKLHNHYI